MVSCNEEEPKSGFSLLQKDKTGLDFRNILKEDENFNIFQYQYYYNGGGVALIDFNNDGLEDVFFTGNMVKNRLYQNLGNLKFKDVTEGSKLADMGGWCTGANAIDINNDGWQDLYVCRAGYPFEDFRKNLLFINNKDGSFTEQAAQYGIDDPAHSTHSSFFDYDLDGDLDLFLLNHSTPEYSKGNLEVFQLRSKKDAPNTNKLYRNDDGLFTDVTPQSGIESNVLSFSLGVITIDFNDDQLPDIFVANDFNEPDYLFLNNGDGTFIDAAPDWFSNMSKFSMGVDATDLTGNDFPDLVTLDMLPESNYLQKMHSGADNYDKVKSLADQGFLDQFSRNTLQLNTGSSFKEIGQFAGISNTDWSWSPLFMDFDNDGQQDLFISNGYQKDHTDMDFLQYTANEVVRVNKGEDAVTFEEYLASMPPINEPNYFYLRKGKFQFENMSTNWRVDLPSVSQGAAYGDLDYDGDLDIVVNNSGDYAWVFRNNHSENGNNWLQVELEGTEKNPKGIGAKVSVFSADDTWTKYVQPSRGFQSTGSYISHFGLGDATTIDSIHVRWADGTLSHVDEVIINQKIRVNKAQSIPFTDPNSTFKSYFTKSDIRIPYTVNASEFRDFNVQRLMPFYLTDTGPLVKVFDMNQDGRQDLIIGGNSTNPTTIIYQLWDGSFGQPVVLKNKINAADLLIEDINGDSRPDIIVANGSYEYQKGGAQASIEVFLNTVTGRFRNVSHSMEDTNPGALALMAPTKGIEYRLIVGGKEWYNQFPNASPTQVFKITAFGLQPLFKIDIGTVNQAETVDLHQDGDPEIILNGPWETPSIFQMKDDTLKEVTDVFLSDTLLGHWTSMEIVDANGDRYPDIILGNIGLNNQLDASREHPLQLFFGDMDDNGSIDPFIGYHVLDGVYPLASREDAIKQVPLLNKRFQSFNAYAQVDMEAFLGEDYTTFAVKAIDTLAHQLLINNRGPLKTASLEVSIQFAPLYACVSMDVDGDGDDDLVTAGNKSSNKVKIGKLSGNEGDVFLNDGKGNYEYLPVRQSGIQLEGDIRSVNQIMINDEIHVIFTPHFGKIELYQLSSKDEKPQ